MPLTLVTPAQVDADIAALDPKFHKAVSNGDEANPALNSAGNFHKTLAHNLGTSLVDAAQFNNFVAALNTAQGAGTPPPPNAFAALDDALPAFSSASEKLTNPAAGLANDIVGIDPRLIPFAPAPSVTSEQCAVEMKEVYWMSLLRDIHFSDYASNAMVTQAVDDLNLNNGAMNYLGGKDLTP